MNLRTDKRLQAELAELAKLADGTLPTQQRGAVEARVAASPELREQLSQQRSAVSALRAIDVTAPDSLRRRVEEMAATAPPGRESRRERRPRSRLRPIALGGAAVLAATAVVLAVTLSGGSAGPTVLQAAALARQPATLPAPVANGSQRNLLTAVEDGVAFPYWEDRFGWRAAGARTDVLSGRGAKTVFYTDAQGRRVAYAILAGKPLAVPAGAVTVQRNGTSFAVLDDGALRVVTWQRDGHTCVLAARGVPAPALLELAAWGGPGSVRA